MASIRGALGRLAIAARAVAGADPAQIETAVQRFGSSRRWLAPVAWTGGALVLVVRGLKLLMLNWRLSLVEVVPALWVWLVTWDLKRHDLRASPMREVTAGQVVLGVAVAVAASVATLWFNTVFGIAISQPTPRIAAAMREARQRRRPVLMAGTGMGVCLAAGLALIPRINQSWLFLLAALGMYSLMLVALVLGPARILGVARLRRTPGEAVGLWVTGGALSAMVMLPGFVVDRVGVVLMGIPHLHLLGLFVLAMGVALYAAGLSSMKAVKLSMKLDNQSSSG